MPDASWQPSVWSGRDGLVLVAAQTFMTMTGGETVVFSSHDGGRSFTEHDVASNRWNEATGDAISAVAIPGWVPVHIVHSTDGGATWSEPALPAVDANSRATYSALRVSVGKTQVTRVTCPRDAVTEQCSLSILSSTDGGAHFTSGPEVLVAHGVGSIAWAAGTWWLLDGSELRTSRDDGRTWTPPIAAPAAGSIAARDDRRATLIVGSGPQGVLYRTLDGGASWEQTGQSR